MSRVKLSRELVAASARPMVLSILSAGDSYGYAIIQEVARRSGGRMQWTEGMLYPVLHRLEREELIESYWDDSEGRKRKYYRLKRDGRKALREEQEQWSAVHAALASLWEPKHV
jgi:DNA-binding PadR family transcriptional regulator